MVSRSKCSIFDVDLFVSICVNSRYNTLSAQLATGDLSTDQLITLGKEFSELSRLMTLVEEREHTLSSILELRQLEQEDLQSCLHYIA